MVSVPSVKTFFSFFWLRNVKCMLLDKKGGGLVLVESWLSLQMIGYILMGEYSSDLERGGSSRQLETRVLLRLVLGWGTGV